MRAQDAKSIVATISHPITALPMRAWVRPLRAVSIALGRMVER